MSKEINAEQLASYVVCPEAWRLKYVEGELSPHVPDSEGAALRREWSVRAELRQQLRRYTKIIFALLAVLVGATMLLDSFGFTPRFVEQSERTSRYWEHFTVPTEIGLLLLVVGLLIFIWDLFDRRATRIQKESGLEKNTELLSVRGSTVLPVKVLRSKSEHLFSKPYALLKEERHIIPVDMHPMANKVRDRHVVPLLLHLHLVELTHGSRPPYGVLLMGKKRRRVQVVNSDDKQRWLMSLLDEMRSIHDGIPAVPAPAVRKCQHCDVETLCAHSMAPRRSHTVTAGTDTSEQE